MADAAWLAGLKVGDDVAVTDIGDAAVAVARVDAVTSTGIVVGTRVYSKANGTAYHAEARIALSAATDQVREAAERRRFADRVEVLAKVKDGLPIGVLRTAMTAIDAAIASAP